MVKKVLHTVFLFLTLSGITFSQQNTDHKPVSIVKDTDNTLPFTTLEDKTFASLSLGDGGKFSDYLGKYTYFNHYQRMDENQDKLLFSRLRNYDIVIVGVFTLSNEAVNLLKRLNSKTKLVICFFGPPDKMKALDAFDRVVCAYTNTPYSQVLVPQALFGARAIAGKSEQPMPAMGRLAYGSPEEVRMDSKTLKRIDLIAEEAIKSWATPGCQVLVAKDGKIVYDHAYGYYTYDSLQPVTDETIYDIASITKVMATLQAFMLLEERGYIDPDKKISVYLPDLKGSNKEHMIIRDILTHQAGLWPYIPFWKNVVEDPLHTPLYFLSGPDTDFPTQVSDHLYATPILQDSLWHWVKTSKVREKSPRKPYDYKYSDMGYYLLQRMIENIINQSMDEFLQQNLYDPMGLSTMSYLPLCKFPLSRIAPTENDAYFRHNLVYGMVHDQGAALAGGVAGHAGLFSNATDLAKMMQMLLQDGVYGGVRFYQPGTISKYTQQQYANNRRGMGWDKPVLADWNSPTSRFASPKTFGHTGFTGTAAWADPEFNLIYIFLSNRIYPDADNAKLIKNNIRTRIQDVVYEAMWEYEKTQDWVEPEAETPKTGGSIE